MYHIFVFHKMESVNFGQIYWQKISDLNKKEPICFYIGFWVVFWVFEWG